MDCRTARQFLVFARPNPAELDGTDLEQMQAHLARCPECDSLLRSERAVDAHVGEAMRSVPTPQGLRERLVQKLKQERDAYYRKWIGRFVRVAAAAAAVAVIVWAGFYWKSRELAPIDSESAIEVVKEMHFSPPDQQYAQAWLDKQKIRTLAPPKFKYSFLASHSLVDFNGQTVPQLTFVKWNAPVGVAQVFVLSGEQFDLRDVPVQYEWNDEGGYGFKVRVWRPVPSHAYVVKYNGKLDDMLELAE